MNLSDMLPVEMQAYNHLSWMFNVLDTPIDNTRLEDELKLYTAKNLHYCLHIKRIQSEVTAMATRVHSIITGATDETTDMTKVSEAAIKSVALLQSFLEEMTSPGNISSKEDLRGAFDLGEVCATLNALFGIVLTLARYKNDPAMAAIRLHAGILMHCLEEMGLILLTEVRGSANELAEPLTNGSNIMQLMYSELGLKPETFHMAFFDPSVQHLEKHTHQVNFSEEELHDIRAKQEAKEKAEAKAKMEKNQLEAAQKFIDRHREVFTHTLDVAALTLRNEAHKELSDIARQISEPMTDPAEATKICQVLEAVGRIGLNDDETDVSPIENGINIILHACQGSTQYFEHRSPADLFGYVVLGQMVPSVEVVFTSTLEPLTSITIAPYVEMDCRGLGLCIRKK